jgi:hypothetical protein
VNIAHFAHQSVPPPASSLTQPACSLSLSLALSFQVRDGGPLAGVEATAPPLSPQVKLLLLPPSPLSFPLINYTILTYGLAMGASIL